MNKGLVVCSTGFALGAGAMYFADPQNGKRRRARLRDAVVHGSHELTAAARTASRDTENRLTGLAARARSLVVGKPAPDDDVLVARVRAAIGRLVSHPGAIEVKAAAGRVGLSGSVFAAEVKQLVRGVRAVDGVVAVDDHLQPHAEAGDVPALQGSGPLEHHALAAGWARWTPATRALAGAAGVTFMVLAARRRTLPRPDVPTQPLITSREA